MSALFVAGAGTDIGKTYVCERLVRGALAQGRRARALKPVASGTPDVSDPAFLQGDTARLLRAQGAPITAATASACSPWRYAAPLSPDMAAAAEGRRLSFAALAQWTRGAIAGAPGELVLVEGVGGVMSPMCEDATNLDLIEALALPTLLVAGSYLGAISHCLTALEATRARGVVVRAIVVNESAGDAVDLAATLASLRRFAKSVAIFALRRDAEDLPIELLGCAIAA